ncbi:class I SAM-dependent methyltransferase [Conexibacter sp. DBS9H8]|uniref:class I SAM-dependent methyltransferase n=1 Tax=Conexibacter sp. DBS9H8 TaxID=2937801 RepID=UPI00201008C6|nr:class I SAM-dependent methyltransferase [Conexibacter sp. DBS9H8]
MTVLSPDEIRDVNTRYHDVAAAGYDAKWGIDFGEVGQRQVVSKVAKVFTPAVLSQGFGRALEIGAGTGYFSLNLKQAGVIDELVCTDISPGMVEVLNANAGRLGLGAVSATRADAESLPFADASFDLVLGHAVLHHLPDLHRSFSEFHRVLRPGGRILFAGEPSRVGDRIAQVPKRTAGVLGPIWRRAVGAPPPPPQSDPDPDHVHDHSLEAFVDIHAFMPQDLSRMARRAGFSAVTVRGEELLANWFGWFNRVLETHADPAQVPMLWRQYAFHGYLALQRVDRVALEPRLPPWLFYNLLLSAQRPDA